MRARLAIIVLLVALTALAGCGDDGGDTTPTTPPPAIGATTNPPPATTTVPVPPPTTQPPATQPPATQPPATQPPATQPPATTAPPADLASRAYGVEDATNVIAERVEFPGSTLETVVGSSVIRAERHVWFVALEAGWLVTTRITSIEDNAVFDLYAPTGELLVSEATVGHALAAEAGDYQIVVGGTRGNATYDLAVGTFPAEVVRFPAGATGTTVAGTALSGSRQAYLLGAAAGQTMTLSVTSVEGNAALAVLAPSGEILDAGATTSRIELPESGDYVVLVGGAPGAATFELEVSIVG